MALENWSKTEKQVSRKAFDNAYKKEYESVRQQLVKMIAEKNKLNEIWEIEKYLSDKRFEMDQKYDYRYSRLLSVFGVLVYEKWLSIEDLEGLSPDKINSIKTFLKIQDITT